MLNTLPDILLVLFIRQRRAYVPHRMEIIRLYIAAVHRLEHVRKHRIILRALFFLCALCKAHNPQHIVMMVEHYHHLI